MKRKSEVRLFFFLTAWSQFPDSINGFICDLMAVPRSTCHLLYLSPWLFMMIMLVLKSILRASYHIHLSIFLKIPLCLQGFSPFSSWQLTTPSTDPALSWDLPASSFMYSCCSRKEWLENFYHLLQLNPVTFRQTCAIGVLFSFRRYFCPSLFNTGSFRLPYSISFSPLLGRKQRAAMDIRLETYSKNEAVTPKTNWASKC